MTVTKDISKLVAEYRPSMDAEVLHSWAKDITAALSEQPAVAVVEPFGWVSMGIFTKNPETVRHWREGGVKHTAVYAAPQPAPQPVAWQWRSRIKGGPWDAWENGRFGQQIPPFMEVEERALYTTPHADLREENERLRHRVKALENALEPFAQAETADGLENGLLRVPDDHPITFKNFDSPVAELTIGDLRHARAALKGGEA